MNLCQGFLNWIRVNITRRPIQIGKRHGAPLIRCWCPKHGYFEDIPRGWDEVMSCPECFREQFRDVGV